MKTNWKKNTSLFLIGQFITMFGSTLVQYAITWHITLETNSGVMLTISILCGFLPGFLVSPFAGVWADRFSKKWIIIISDALIAVATLLLALLFFLGFEMLTLLFAISVIRSFGSGIQSPAVSAYLPILVPKEKLTKVNSLNSSMHSFITLISPLLSGVLLGMFALQYVFFIDVITATIAIIILFFFVYEPKREKDNANEKIDYFKDLKLGLRYISENKYLGQFIFFNAAFLIFVAPVAFLTPLQITRNFGQSYNNLTLLEITFSGGMILGSLIIGWWKGFKNRLTTMVLANILISLLVMSLGLAPVLWVYLAILVFIGMAIPSFNIPAMVILQEQVDINYMGRVFSIFGMVASIMMPIGMVIFGPLADVVAIELLLLVSSAGMLVISIAMAFSKQLRAVGWPIQKEEEVV